MPGRIGLAWTPRAAPLAPRAVAADGATAYALGRRLLALGDAGLARLSAVAAPGLLVVLGEELPWVDGVTYLGSDPLAPSLLLPTALAPTVPVAALERAVARKRPGRVAVLPSPTRLVPCDAARAIDPERLAAWLAASATAIPTLPVAVAR